MYFKKLEIGQWQQFESVRIDFHDRLTVITGANGSGKTTILNLFARHSGWEIFSLSTPKEEKSTGIVKFFVYIFHIFFEEKEYLGFTEQIKALDKNSSVHR